jgi:hypothetical protein
VIEDSATYELQVRPWGRPDLASFVVRFDANCVNGQCSFAEQSSQMADAVDGSYNLTFPTPNISGKICNSRSDDTCIGVFDSWIGVEQEIDSPYDPGKKIWKWTNQSTNTGRSGGFKLNFADGRYRITGYPSWRENQEDGISRSAIVTVEDEVATWADLDDFDTDAEGLQIKLLAANVRGTISYQKDGEVSAMKYAWVVAYDQAGDYVSSASADQNGKYQMYLPEGDYTVWAYPNWGIAQRTPVSMDVSIDEYKEISNWAYSSPVSGDEETSEGDINLDAVPANTVFTLLGVDAKRIVNVLDGEGNILSEYSTISSGTKDGSDNQVSLTLPSGSYQLQVLSTPSDPSNWGTYTFVKSEEMLEENLTLDADLNVFSPES